MLSDSSDTQRTLGSTGKHHLSSAPGATNSAVSPKRRTPGNKGKRYPVEILTPREVECLLRNCSHRAPTGVRNRALIAVLYRTGIRISEALALFTKDVDQIQCTVRILLGKGKKTRTAGIDTSALAVLEKWSLCRAVLGIGDKSPLFCTLTGGKLSTSYVRSLFARLGRKAGISKRVHPHGLRHSHAHELAMEKIPVHLIQKQLGHSNLSTTSQYLDHLSASDVVEAIKGRIWIGSESMGTA